MHDSMNFKQSCPEV